ncbi:MAG TPA: sigma-70 family RNA polymerase sigma factor [Terriglobales bacterium]|jgi:RNA polymerase sigma-70 factor (ECF subfamily)|nr:sigma-70 family RNA polymerase sigma factor [Terriglobales bacterium]
MEQGSILKLSPVLGLEQVENHRKHKPEETIVEMYASLRPSLLSYAYQVVGSTGESEDLVQIAFLKLFDQLQRNSHILNIRSWLYRVVHNLAIDHIRRNGIHESAVAEWLSQRSRAGSVRSTEEELIQQQRISDSLRILNERERHCLLLRAEGLSYQEIGGVLGISEKAVSVYLARGLKKFEVQNETCA